MSRTIYIMILGFIAVVVVGVFTTVAVLVGRSFFVIADQSGQPGTPLVVEATAVSTDSPPSATPLLEPTPSATTAVPTITALPPTMTAAPPTAIVVSPTTVQYVMALTDVNIRSGPGTSYNVVGWVADGQSAKVTGMSSNGSWWRVVCPDGSIGSCWMTAGTQYTQAASAPATAVPACTHSASLVSDVSVPDGTQFAPTTGFNKTWRIKNSGTCTWDSRYQLIHHAGSTLGSISNSFPLPGIVAPGQTVDLTVSLVSPAAAGNYQSDWLLQTPGGLPFGVGRSGSPFWVKIVVPASSTTTVSGLVYQDANQNGIYDSGETLLSNREVRLVQEAACHVPQAPLASTYSDGNGRYTFSGSFNGSYCIGLIGQGGLQDDVLGVTVTAGQSLNNINLKGIVASSSISGYVWSDYCLTNENGDFLDGNCVVDGNGDYHADGMIQPNESYIAGITILLQTGACATDNPVAVSAVTDALGRYTFNNLNPGTYCVFMNAARPENAPLLLPGDWTFPTRGIWYHELNMLPGAQAYAVNFGWDYQLK